MSYQLVHVFWRFEGNIDALIWLGAHRADRAGQLVRVWDGEQEKEKLLQAARKRGLPQLSGWSPHSSGDLVGGNGL